jgi:hypothetical protein
MNISYTHSSCFNRVASLGAFVAAGLFLTAASASALDYTTSFSIADGYTTGQLNANADWYFANSNQYLVTASSDSGLVSAPTSATQRIYYTESFNTSVSNYTLSTNFSFTASQIPTTNSAIFALSLIGDTSLAAGSSNMTMEAGIYQTTGGTYLIQFITQGVSGQFKVSTGYFTAAQLGISGTDLTSDNLNITLTVTRGEDASSWSYVATLENLDNSSAGTITVSATVSSTADFFSSTTLYGGYSTSGASSAQVSSISVTSFSLSQIPESSATLWMLPAGALAFSLLRRRNRR